MEQQDVIFIDLFSNYNCTQSHPRLEIRGPELWGGKFKPW